MDTTTKIFLERLESVEPRTKEYMRIIITEHRRAKRADLIDDNVEKQRAQERCLTALMHLLRVAEKAGLERRR